MNVSKKKWIQAIAILEIIGGTVGILFMIYVALASDLSLGVVVVLSFSLGIFSLSFFSGISLLQGKESGRKASIVTQFIQLPKLVSPLLTFTFSFGFDVFPNLSSINGFTSAGIQFRVLADSQVFINSAGAPFLLGISIPAICALTVLWNYDVNETADPSEATPPSPSEYFEPPTV